jgi:hypothetical protein
VNNTRFSPGVLRRASHALAWSGAAYGAIGACALYVLFTRFPRPAPLVVTDLASLLLVAPTTGALLGAVAPRLERITLGSAAIAACFLAHIAFIRIDSSITWLVCARGPALCLGRGVPIPTRALAPELLVVGVLIGVGLARRRARVLASIARENVDYADVFS